MSLKAILFDLDGTLLPLNQETFTAEYFAALTKAVKKAGLNHENILKAVTTGVVKMVKNNGDKTNEKVFWENFKDITGEDIERYLPIFDDYYNNGFAELKLSCGYNSLAVEAVESLKARGIRTVLATNPLFPKIATEKRMQWAGFDINDFELYTTYENCCYCKPNPAYYTEILQKLDLNPNECLMVGNDAIEDVAARKAGLDVFLITDCLINNDNVDISGLSCGGFKELLDYVLTIND